MEGSIDVFTGRTRIFEQSIVLITCRIDCPMTQLSTITIPALCDYGPCLSTSAEGT